MKTPVEMQLKILDKMRENVENGNSLYDDIQANHPSDDSWFNIGTLSEDDFSEVAYLQLRIKPKTILVNGVSIKTPLSNGDISNNVIYYYPQNTKDLYSSSSGINILNLGVLFVYNTKEEAIEASKLLFGLKD